MLHVSMRHLINSGGLRGFELYIILKVTAPKITENEKGVWYHNGKCTALLCNRSWVQIIGTVKVQLSPNMFHKHYAETMLIQCTDLRIRTLTGGLLYRTEVYNSLKNLLALTVFHLDAKKMKKKKCRKFWKSHSPCFKIYWQMWAEEWNFTPL